MATSKLESFKKKKRFFIAILFCLLPLVFILNIGYVARTFTIGFSYLFGIGSYFIYLLIYIFGMALIIKKNKFRFFKVRTVVASLLVLIGMCTLCSIAVHEQPKWDSINVVFDELNADGGYWKKGFLNLFAQWGQKYAFGGGLLGYSIAGAMVFAGKACVYAIAIILLIAGIFLYFFPLFIKKIKATKVSEKTLQTIENKQIEDKKIGDKVVEPIQEEKNETIPSTVKIAPINQSPFFNQPAFIEESSSELPDSNGLTKARYFKDENFDQDNNQNIPSVQPFAKATPEPEPLSKEPELVEQTSLDFNAKPIFNDALVTAKPVFEERAKIDKPVEETTQPVISEAEAPKPPKKTVWVPPSSDMLNDYVDEKAIEINTKIAQERAAVIDEVLNNFGIRAHVDHFDIGPSVTRYNIDFDIGVSTKEVENRKDDIARQLGGVQVRFSTLVEGTRFSGLEVPNGTVTTVGFKEVFSALPDPQDHPLAVAFGKNITGDVVWADFNAFPHILVAGTTGSGKSIFIHSLISTLIMRCPPETLRLCLVDPKKNEWIRYKDIPQLLCPILTEPNSVKPMMDKMVEEMNHRYTLFQEDDGYSDIKEYNAHCKEVGLPTLPYIIVILDEYGDLVGACKEVSLPIVALGQKARACGIHVLISTQTPTTDIVTSAIKNNLPVHVAFLTSNYNQSMTVLGEGGAEGLLGKGDMLVQAGCVSHTDLVRLQGCYIERAETSKIVKYLRDNYDVNYDDNFLAVDEAATQNGALMAANGEIGAFKDKEEENKYQSIKEFVMSQNYMSMSRLQGECSIGFNRARRFFVRLQNEGIVAKEADGNRGCPVLAHDHYDDVDDDVPTSDELSHY